MNAHKDFCMDKENCYSCNPAARRAYDEGFKRRLEEASDEELQLELSRRKNLVEQRRANLKARYDETARNLAKLAQEIKSYDEHFPRTNSQTYQETPKTFPELELDPSAFKDS